MASPGRKHRQFNDGTRPPDSTPATTGSPTSNQPSDSFRKQIFGRPIESGNEKGLEADSESAKNASQQSTETIVDVNLTRNDETHRSARSDFTQPAPNPPPEINSRNSRPDPAVQDEEKVIETRMEINLGTDVVKLVMTPRPFRQHKTQQEFKDDLQRSLRESNDSFHRSMREM